MLNIEKKQIYKLKLERISKFSLLQINEAIEKHGEYFSKHESESNLKFLIYHKEHILRCLENFERINPYGSVYEIGPGACYFLYFCKNINNCEINGVDLESPIFKIIRKNCNINIIEKNVVAFRKIPFEGSHDFIVTFLTMFNSGWGIDSHKYWLSDCYHHLKDGGNLVIHFNRRTFHNEISPIYKKIGEEINDLTYSINKKNLEQFKEYQNLICP